MKEVRMQQRKRRNRAEIWRAMISEAKGSEYFKDNSQRRHKIKTQILNAPTEVIRPMVTLVRGQ